MSNSTLPKRGLSDLPEELLLGILDEVGSGFDEKYIPGTIQTLHSLSATSRQFHRLTEPYLYRSVKTDHYYCVKLIQRLENKPTLVRHIKRLVWDKRPQSTPEWYWDLLDRFKAPNLARQFKIRISDYLGDFYSGDDRARSTLLLMLTPSLEALEMLEPNLENRWRFRGESASFLSLLDNTSRDFAPTINRRFSNIRALQLAHKDMELDDIVTILQLPALSTLSFKGHICYEWRDPVRLASVARLAAIPPRSSPIENLYIEENRIHSKYVAMILRSIKALRDIRLVFNEYRYTDVRDARYADMRIISDYGTPTLHYPTLIRAIMKHSDTLESLTIRNTSWFEPRIYSTAAAGCLHLRQMRNLQHLSTDIVTLCRDETVNPDRQHDLFNALPPSIRRLDLDVYEPVWPYFRCPKPALLSLATDCAQRYPLLKEIRIVRERESGWASRKAFREIEVAFQLQGVALKFYHRHGMAG